MGMDEDSPANWAEALMALIASRIALIRIEARESAKSGVRRVLGLLAAVLCLFFTWILLLAGGIGAIAAASGWPWYWLAITAAGIHLLAAILLAKACKKPVAPAFPITLAEFQKDREWIENIQNRHKSND
jgi:uncharacterized membrane protein YqjE